MASEGPPRALELREGLNARIDPSRENVAEFSARVLRIAGALDVIGDPVGGMDLAEILGKGEYAAILFQLPPDSQVTLLKTLLIDVMINDGISEEERAGKSNAIIEMMRVRDGMSAPGRSGCLALLRIPRCRLPSGLKRSKQESLPPKPPFPQCPERQLTQARSVAWTVGLVMVVLAVCGRPMMVTAVVRRLVVFSAVQKRHSQRRP